MERKKYYNRDWRTVEEKEDIARKSNNKCCHCGKEKYVHYGATIDHFIPLDKGGCDRYINCIMLCEDCNQEKGTKIVGLDYVPYLKEKYKKELKQYLDSYIQTMDYVNNNRIFALDEYTIKVQSVLALKFKNQKHTKGMYLTYKYKKATIDDIDRLLEYYVKYLKKVDSLDDEEAARNNLIFWLSFGSIYYIEVKNEIKLLTVITMRKMADYESYKGINISPQIYCFPYYLTDDYISLTVNLLLNFIPQTIIDEQNLFALPYKIVMINSDKLSNYLAIYMKNKDKNRDKHIPIGYDHEVKDFVDYFIIADARTDKNKSTDEEMVEAINKFNKNFSDVTNQLIKYFSKYINISIGWMIFDLMSFDYIKETPLHDMLFTEDGHMKIVEEEYNE